MSGVRSPRTGPAAERVPRRPEGVRGRPGALPPGPSLPAAVQTLWWTRSPTGILDRCSRRHGPTFTLDLVGLTPGRYVFFSDPADVQEVFGASDRALLAGRNNDFMRPLVGARSLLLTDGAEYRRQRRVVMPLLHGKALHPHGETVQQAAEDTVRRWPLGQPFSLHDELRHLTLGLVIGTVLGLEGDAARELEPLLSALLDTSLSPAVLVPALQLPVPFSPWARFLRLRRAVDEVLLTLVAERRRAADLTSRRDVLSSLLQADEAGRPAVGHLEMRDQLVTLLVAGHETTAGTLAWVFERLLTHPAAARALDAELRQGGEPLPVDDVLALPFLDAVIAETLRLNPVFPALGRTVQQPVEIGGRALPPGVTVAACPYLLQRDPRHHPRPDEFLPARFLGGRPDPSTWAPFGGGLRRCVGMAFAQFQMKLVVATVWAGCRLRLVPPGPLRPVRRGIGLVPEGGTRVVVAERSLR